MHKAQSLPPGWEGREESQAWGPQGVCGGSPRHLARAGVPAAEEGSRAGGSRFNAAKKQGAASLFKSERWGLPRSHVGGRDVLISAQDGAQRLRGEIAGCRPLPTQHA